MPETGLTMLKSAVRFSHWIHKKMTEILSVEPEYLTNKKNEQILF